jgi:hypothetical protein
MATGSTNLRMFCFLLAHCVSLGHDISKMKTLSDVKPMKSDICFLNVGSGLCKASDVPPDFGWSLQVFTGPLLETFPFTLESIRKNPDYQWLFVHIGDLQEKPDLDWEVNQ